MFYFIFYMNFFISKQLKIVTLSNGLENKIVRSAMVFYRKISYGLTNIFKNYGVNIITTKKQ